MSEKEKKYKPVPDVEALRYKGTPEKPDIKIFVSHRIDQNSETIDNPLYVPVRCGAVYDERKNVEMLGDDTGDNISNRRKSFCELTVQYWAWKNVAADYYGLCHYRRLLSFSDNEYTQTIDVYNHVIENTFGEAFVEKFGLTEANMRAKISEQDVVSIVPMQLDQLENQKPITVYESLENNPTVFPIADVDKFIAVFKQKYPDYIEDIDGYFSGYTWRAFNCYVLKKDLYFEYSSMLFDVLFEFEKEIDSKFYNQEQLRLPGYMGETMFAIYYNHIKRTRNLRLKEVQLVRVDNPEKIEEIKPAFEKNNVPVVMSSSNEYVPFLATLLKSIQINSNANRNYDIIVFSNKIRKENKKILLEMFQKQSNFSLRFINAERYLGGRKFHTAMHVTPMTYLRLAMLDVLKNYEKAIYLDCDVIVNSDIAELYDTNLDGYMIGAAVDTVMAGWCNTKDNPQIKYNEKVVGLKNRFTYFNAGVIVVNIVEFAKYYATKELLDLAASRKWKWFDQDVLNRVCEGKVHLIGNEWNVMSHQHDFDYQMAEFYAPDFIFAGYKKALENPKAIHYAGRFIPCFVPTVDLATYFWKYARLTPYYELILSAMCSNQIQVFHNTLPVDNRTGARKVADKLMPPNSLRRKIAKFLVPRDSLQWKLLKQIYYIFRPNYRPKKVAETVEDED